VILYVPTVAVAATTIPECPGSAYEGNLAGEPTVGWVFLLDPVSKCPDEWFVEPLDFALDPK